MRRTPGHLTRLAAAFVVALLLAVAGTSVSSAAPAGTDHGSTLAHQSTGHPSAATVTPHRVAASPRHDHQATADLGSDLMVQVGSLLSPGRGAAHAPVQQTSFCSTDRAPPV